MVYDLDMKSVLLPLLHRVEFAPESGKSTPQNFEIEYLTQESIFCEKSKRETQHMDMASVL